MLSNNSDIEPSLLENYLFDNDTPNLAHILNTISVGIWELHLDTKKTKWSLGFYRMLGYEPGETVCSYANFMETLLYYEDKAAFLKSINDIYFTETSVIDVRLLTKSGYEWFQSNFQVNNATNSLVGTFTNIHQFKISQLQLAIDNQLINENSKLFKLGRWDIEVATNKLSLSEEALQILNVESQIDNIEQFITFFEPHSRFLIKDAIHACILNCRPFDLDFKLVTSGNNVIWIKMKAVAKIDQYGKCEAVKGVIQDIDISKQNENKLKSSLKDVNQQNKRLENFAYIVSHNLRSYVGNLQIMVNLHEEAADFEDRSEIFGHIKTVSNTLSSMIQHLNEIVKIDAEKSRDKTLIEFELLFKNIISALQTNIQMVGATVKYDFSNCKTVRYLPAYLESIFHNLLTNSLKYRHPERHPYITCESKVKDGHTYLIFEDNGVGIDMEKYGDKLFGMYQTFHKNDDAQGIGLYITRNQIEALGGSISVESTLNVGTRFTIRLT
jgi:signal transduction histidine kinase